MIGAALAWLSSAGAVIRSSRPAQAVLVVIACGLAALAFKLWLGGERKQAAREAVTIERQQGAAEVIKRTERANNAAQTIDRDADARRNECVRHARNPENC